MQHTLNILSPAGNFHLERFKKLHALGIKRHLRKYSSISSCGRQHIATLTAVCSECIISIWNDWFIKWELWLLAACHQTQTGYSGDAVKGSISRWLLIRITGLLSCRVDLRLRPRWKCGLKDIISVWRHTFNWWFDIMMKTDHSFELNFFNV